MVYHHRIVCSSGRSVGCTCGGVERGRESARRRKAQDPERIREQDRRRRRAISPELKAEQLRRWREANRDASNAYSRRYKADPVVKERIRQRAKEDQARATRRGTWDLDEVVLLLSEPSNKIVGYNLGRAMHNVAAKRRWLKMRGITLVTLLLDEISV